MTQIAAMAKSLLKGEVLSVMNCFRWFGVTNCAREIGRSIERKFDVQVSRVRKEGLSRYEQSVSYVEYRLLRTEENKEGIKKMIAYISEIEQQEFKSIVKRGAKPDLFSHTAEEKAAWDLYMDN
jgi:hypothetical protein